ncbi:MAG: Gfo/Idh/MocA family oxidoreductase, partial [Acidobacteria bacterium]|nr:Gfo/Idh/MocA family oxidoreductase [Acidobacteriota bacterium]
YARQHGLPRVTTDLEELLSWPVDAVYISTTNEQHAHQAIASARAGKHVLAEKPMALSVGDATAMITAARDHSVILATNHHLRAAGTHEKIRDVVHQGELGEIYHAHVAHAVGLAERLQGWRVTGERPGSGVVWDLLVHNVDTLRADLVSEPVDVTALTSTTSLSRPGVVDLSLCTFAFDNGALVSTSESFAVPFGRTSLEIHGSKGSLLASDVMTPDPVGDIVLTTSAGRRELDVPDRENLYVKTLRRFAEAVEGRGAPYSTGEDGRIAVACAVAALTSATERRTVRVADVLHA